MKYVWCLLIFVIYIGFGEAKWSGRRCKSSFDVASQKEWIGHLLWGGGTDVLKFNVILFVTL